MPDHLLGDDGTGFTDHPHCCLRPLPGAGGTAGGALVPGQFVATVTVGGGSVRLACDPATWSERETYNRHPEAHPPNLPLTREE